MFSDFEINKLQEVFNLPFPKINKITFSKHSIDRIRQRIRNEDIGNYIKQIRMRIIELAKYNSFYESSERNFPLWIEVDGRLIEIPVVLKPEVNHELTVITVWNKELSNN